ncbi:MAG: hypothetical protein M3198_11790, partial [Actinomycetota bacterium]|nr:hypothetical protein [Actinomycetota bacterium]
MRNCDDTYNLLELGAVHWLARSLAFFDPGRYRLADKPLRDCARRAVGELSSLVALRLRIDERPLSPDYLAIVDHLAAVTSRPSFVDLVAHRRWSLWVCGMPYVALRLAGREDPEQRWLLQQAVTVGCPLTWESETWRHLEYAHFLRLAGIEHSLPTPSQVFPMTLLNHSPNGAISNEEDAYAIAHTVWYMTDYGLTQPLWPVGFAPGEAGDIVGALLRRYRLEGQSDLVAELAAAAIALGDQASSELRAAWSYLRELQRPDGSLPSPPHLSPDETWDDVY